MDVEIFCLCRSVQVSDLNQPSLFNIFDKKIAIGAPVLIDPFYLVASIRFYKPEFGKQHRFNIVVRDGLGNVLVTSTEIVEISEPKQESSSHFIACAMPARVSEFETYWFTIESEGKSLAKTPLYVIPV